LSAGKAGVILASGVAVGDIVSMRMAIFGIRLAGLLASVSSCLGLSLLVLWYNTDLCRFILLFDRIPSRRRSDAFS
jgi:hypothetical protein